MADAESARRQQVILLGAPGAGKGTQGDRLAARFGIPKISTGDILRQAIAQGTPLGREVAPIMEQGRLVPDELLMGIVRERLLQDDCRRGFILDGFPRTLAQAEGLATMVESSSPWVVVNVDVSPAELMRRVSGRRWCPTCQATYHVVSSPPRRESVCDRDGKALIQRDDDREASVARRLEEYERRTAPLIDYYRARPGFREIDGDRSVEAVFADLRRILEDAR